MYRQSSPESLWPTLYPLSTNRWHQSQTMYLIRFSVALGLSRQYQLFIVPAFDQLLNHRAADSLVLSQKEHFFRVV